MTDRLRVTAKDPAADGVVVLTLAHPDGERLPDWAPGAHIDLVLPSGVTRQYSLCGDRFDTTRYRVGVLREVDGRGGSAYVHDVLRVGDTVDVGGPRNNFPLVPSERYLFVAGGIGITPLLPMVRQADLLGADWTLVYGGRRRGSMAFLEAVERACAHWPPHSLRTERFVAPEQAAPARDTPFEVRLARTGATVTVSPDRTVLDAVRAAGVDVLSSCRQGICGTCETDVLDGLADHRDAILSDDERQAGDCMFICVSRSRSDLLVLDI